MSWPFAVQGIDYERIDIVKLERRQHNLLDPRCSFADRFQRLQKRVRGADFIVTVGPDQQQMPHFSVRDQVLNKLKACRVHPLQIVEEQRQRVLLPGECPEEPPEHRLEAVLRISRR